MTNGKYWLNSKKKKNKKMSNHRQRQRRERLLSFTLLQLGTVLFTIFEGTYSSKTYSISNAGELITFSNSVNDGTTFEGTTVFLTEDIDFSSSNKSGFEPIGKSDKSKNFLGVFDGQGHIIKNLVMSSSDFRFTGLFGYSEGVSIRNLVLDETCSFSRYHLPNDSVNNNGTFISTIIGAWATGTGKTCIIENVVNKASISYQDKNSKYVIAGGIIAKCSGNCKITNCINFGSILTSSDDASSYIYSGGIAGEVETNGFSSIKRCLNYGPVSNTMKGNDGISIGGIVGVIWENTVIEDCVSYGPLSSEKNLAITLYIGSIIGSVNKKTNNTIRNSFWAESVGDYNPSGKVINNSAILAVEDTEDIEMNETNFILLNKALNLNDSTRWVIVDLKGGNVGGASYEGMAFPQDHTPDPVKEGHSFKGWCNNSEANCSDTQDPKVLNDWDSIYLYAKWAVNNYTLTFKFDNGVEPEVKVFKFNETIDFPNNPNQEGHLFFGWDSSITRMPARNLTINAIWVNITEPKNSIKIVFGTVDLNDNDIKEIIKKYTDQDNFEIIEVIKEDESINVIVKFVDATEARSFIEKVSASTEDDRELIKTVGFIEGNPGSFTVDSIPLLSLYTYFLTF